MGYINAKEELQLCYSRVVQQADIPPEFAPSMHSSQVNTDLFHPLRQLLQAELDCAGLSLDVPGDIASAQGFMRWYLQAIQALEAHVAEGEAQAPMIRSEVELWLRCAMTGATLQDAVQLLARFADMLYPRAGKISLQYRGDQVLFQLDSLRSRVSTPSSLVDITGLFSLRQFLQWLAGRELPLQQVRAGPIRRDDVLPFLRLFGAPVLSGGSDYALAFPSSVLSWPVLRTPREFPAFFELFPCAVFLPGHHSLAGQVSALLSAMVAQGTAMPTQARLARDLGRSLSAFRQQLHREGTGFRELREQVLADEAAAALARGEAVVSIAARLGFADSGSFRRAFRQWHGCAPRDWQAKMRKNSH